MVSKITYALAVSVMPLLVVSFFATPVSAQEQKAMSMDDLLRQVEKGRVTDNRENSAREARFKQARAEQQNMLRDAEREKASEESRSQRLEDDFEANELDIEILTQTLNERLGSLKELFGVMQQVAGDTRVRFDNSLTNIQYPDRGEFLCGSDNSVEPGIPGGA